ncbi:MAG: NHLP bacteriocin export ABC transporter permease/ATPase subunit [Bacteroidales bacterium]|nr:NHLP bacteriocin export ABC transporter permease/ATPase subunit [Bacteroidales bacterium]
MQEKWKDTGERVELKSNRFITLTESKYLYYLAEGKANVYYSAFENQTPAGRRNFIFSLQQGQIALGLENERLENGLMLLVVAEGDCLFKKIPVTEFEKPLSEKPEKEYISGLIDGWIKNCASFIQGGMVPYEFIEPENGEQFSSQANECILSSEVKWVKQISGQSRVASLELLAESKELYFPVCGQLWLTSTEESSYLGYDTISLFDQYLLLSSLLRFNKWFYDYLVWNQQITIEKDRSLLLNKIAGQKAAFSGTAQVFSSIFGKKSNTYFISETEASDELLATCQMIAKAGGFRIVKPKPVASDRISDRLDVILFASHIQKRKVTLEKDWWKLDIEPLLVFSKTDQKPAAVIPIHPGKNVLIRPFTQEAIALNAVTAETLCSEGFSFFRPLPDKKLTFKDLLIYSFRKSSKDLWRLALVGILLGLLGMVTPVLTGSIFEQVIPNANQSLLLGIVIALTVSAFVNIMFIYVRGMSVQRIQTRITASLQIAVWDRILHLPASFFRKYTSGEMAMRANGINSIMQVLSGTVINTVLTGIFTLFNFFLLYYYDSGLVFPTVIILLAVLLGVIILTGYLQTRQQTRIVSLMQKISGKTLQFINGISKLRVSGTEKNAFSIWANMYADQRQSEFRNRRIGNFYSAFNVAFPVICTLLLYSLIFDRLNEKYLGIGAFIAFMSAFSSLSISILSVGQSFTSVMQAVPFYRNLKPILESVTEFDSSKAHPGDLVGNIGFQHVSFRYDPDGPLVLNNISLKVPAGKFVAVVGPSGSGKSTLIRLLLGFETPEQGAIYIDDQELATLEIQAVRRQTGTVLQQGKLMPGSIFSNIAGVSNLTEDDAWEAARLVGFDEDIRQMPMGMQTMVSEGGRNLSGGQRQRLLIARAIITKPRILIFDEATSALDNRTQAIITESLNLLKVTRLVIAHRLSTIREADYIYVLKDGQMCEEGTFDQLFAENGIFTALVKRQME